MDFPPPQINFRLTSYQDLFSDFDSRNYDVRALSEDFLFSLNQATQSLQTGDEFQLAFEIPEQERNEGAEENIIKRLHGHFRRHAHMLTKDKQKLLQKGIILVLSGFVLIALAAFAVVLEKNHIAWNLLRVLLEPSGWFISWFGFEHLFYLAKEMDQKLNFYRKMSHAAIKFSAVP